MSAAARQEHPFEPLFDARSRILILGSFPSVRSREDGFYYAHPRNRFWRVLALLLGQPEPESIPEKKRLLLDSGIALWDAARSCEVKGSSDGSIRSVIPNDIGSILNGADIRGVYCNGRTAYGIYTKLCEPLTGVKAEPLPSTSPANAAMSAEKLAEAWKVILERLK